MTVANDDLITDLFVNMYTVQLGSPILALDLRGLNLSSLCLWHGNYVCIIEVRHVTSADTATIGHRPMVKNDLIFIANNSIYNGDPCCSAHPRAKQTNVRWVKLF